MAYESRRLSLEPFEERTLPSSSYFLNPPDFALSARHAKVSDVDSSTRAAVMSVFTVWTGTLVTPDGSVFRVRVIFESPFVRFGLPGSSEDSSASRRVTPEPKAPAGSGDDNLAPGGSQVRDLAPQGPARSIDQRAPATSAVVPPPDPTPPGRADGATTVAAGAAQPQAATVQGGVPVAAQFLSGQIVALATAGRVWGAESIDVAEAPPKAIPPAQTEEPPLAPPLPAEEPAAESIVEVPGTFILPAAGVLPVDLTTISACATNFLDRVADLDVALPDDVTGFEDYVWTAAAVLLAGGAVYSMTGSRNSRSSRRLVDTGSALAEWEGKNVGRPY